MNSRDEFFSNIRQALGRTSATPSVAPVEATALSQDARSVEARVELLKQFMEANATELMSELQDSATQAGWNVKRVPSIQDAARHIETLARDLEARTILRSTHPVLKRLDIETALSGTGIEVGVMAVEEGANKAQRDEQRTRLRQQVIEASIGITGVDYAIAETGTCVLLARKGVSRLVSLLPPVHVAVVELGQVLPSLDELFTLRRNEFLHENLGSYMSLITGPSRSADIEYTLVTGVHGPGEVHMVLIG
ncbi:MAG: lactate utilization protein [Chloroflexi bacterium]|nr:lactate utilization protein [Chloroflexota bacterium]